MPRKPPAQVRADLPREPRSWESRAVIPGLSGKTLAGIARLERRSRGLWPGATHRAFTHWHWTVHRRGPRVIYPVDDQCCDLWTGCRGTLERVRLTLPRAAGRELLAVLAPLDEKFLARTLNDPYAPPGDPWWRRRLDTP
ncbi:hypothetical protein [Streptomyces sp. ISL-94]|uniref:hypothetical protein n=1 Tax=Streptomyces sp. ISL-94 TaxID=2819190 RepID=UPI001BE63E36|nr:hypothetical protein [Streptomyces sp. ISL-94]MBT2482956.1 hypothetical protein [Streptomyces sp. ISL-94]